MKVTLDTLKALGACAEYLNQFTRLWPDGVEVTVENCRAAVAAGLDVDWFANHALPPDANDAYMTATDPAYAARSQAIGSASADYRKADNIASDAYEAAVAAAPPAYAARNVAVGAAMATHDKALATATATLADAMESAEATLGRALADALAAAVAETESIITGETL